jgi:hypothetical protein
MTAVFLPCREREESMQEKTYLTHAIEIADMKAQYDGEAKKIVSDKGVLSWILKYTVEELQDCTLEEIRNAIEDVKVAAVPLQPGRKIPEVITGMSTEDKVPNEGMVTYDVRFYVITPKGERIKLLLNVEIQGDFYPGYDLVTRAVFYCARMLSAQLNTEFTAESYDDIKKVYSIWICLDAPKNEADTIIEYRIEPNVIYGTMLKQHRYDLLSVVMIGINEDSSQKKETPLHGFLGTVFSERLKPEEKLNCLEQEYGIETMKEIRKEVEPMGNLGDAIEKRGISKGEEQKLIELICRKVKKGKKLDVIAEELEEDTDAISAIYEAVLKEAPEYNGARIYELLHNAN